jgi:hypothetical protein
MFTPSTAGGRHGSNLRAAKQSPWRFTLTAILDQDSRRESMDSPARDELIRQSDNLILPAWQLLHQIEAIHLDLRTVVVRHIAE